jgi:hypothetical protein
MAAPFIAAARGARGLEAVGAINNVDAVFRREK